MKIRLLIFFGMPLVGLGAALFFVNSAPSPQVSESASKNGALEGIYLTGWLVPANRMVSHIIDVPSSANLNTVVVDVKDFAGRTLERSALLHILKKKGLYVIARIVVFQDPVFASENPNLGVRSGHTGGLWRDKNNLAWVDPASKEAWAYNVAIAKNALAQGFDEINFDYVRFPSDGDLQDTVFPLWDQVILRRDVIKGFFEYARAQLPQAKLSVDVFGYATTHTDDLGIGQILEDAFENFDYVDPMVYPSHYNAGFQGFDVPSEHPYEVVKASLAGGLKRLKASGFNAHLRPWLQDFTLTVPYDKEKVKAEIQATHDALGQDFAGFLLWNSANTYSLDALAAQ